ncbi:expressed unknown protein [Seminavis robusta]|uniref:Uncharacterized protein n=1 Tax=Seminavis robusta TaxID=568900 RepID=A0A9N8H7Y6_9STRA|nr:expressed unknown protein [Seminavis robusta]|eukprot:Sro143_g066500.1 n/a (819) ;mRNA; r:23352-25808
MTAGSNNGTGDASGSINDMHLSPFRVLGIALVVDQLGKEARMAFRYPTSLNSGTTSDRGGDNHHYPTMKSSSSSSNELFFTLSSRQMAKLFRPKHALCGQPMTLSVGGTVFCFRAVLMGDSSVESSSNHHSNSNNNEATTAAAASSSASVTSSNSNNTNNNTATNNNLHTNSDQLVLFSVIVALAPQIDISSIPISGWYEGNDNENQADLLNQSLHRFYSSASVGGSSDGMGSHSSHIPVSQENHRASASFLAIRRVQLSLARLCRVLEREEKRCRYISIQTNHFFRIRAELQKKWEAGVVVPPNGAGAGNTKPPSSPKSEFSGKGPSAAERSKKGAAHHRRGNSFSHGILGGGDASVKEHRRKDSTSSTNPHPTPSAELLEEDKEQEILEQILASGPQKEDGADRQQHGNLGRELVHVFHALSRNDHDFPPSPSVLSGRDGVVYVNRHIAVAMEAVSQPKTLSSAQQKLNSVIVRPYHTLIFPIANASPSQLLQALQSSGFTVPLQQLLLMVRPSKPLMDIAVDANLKLSVTMELANYMVSHGACVASTVLTRASRLACKRVDRIQELALDFSQTFDDWSVSLFLIVNFLTNNGRTLGESMKALTTGDDVVSASLRAGILSAMFHEDDTDEYIFVENNDEGVNGVVVNGPGYVSPGPSEDLKQHQLLHPRSEELDEVLYSMAIWLLSHQVLAHVQDYLVLHSSVSSGNSSHPPTTAPLAGSPDATMPTKTTPAAATTNADGKASRVDASTAEPPMTFDDSLLKELHESDCLNGNASIVAISWRLGLDEGRLRAWAARHDKLRIVSRVAATGDDWGAV